MSVPFPPSARIPRPVAIPASGLPRRVAEVLQSVHQAAFELLVEPLDRLMPELESMLSQVQDRGGQQAAGARTEQLRMLQTRHSAFIARYLANIDEELAGVRDTARLPPHTVEPVASMPSFEDMRLVDDDEADEATEVRAIAQRQESRAPLPLHLLCQRFAVLAESPAFDPARLPVGARRLCEMLLAAGEAVGFGIDLRIAILHEFDRRVLTEYNAIAETFNDLLARNRIMPGLSYVPLRARPRSAPSEGDVASARERPHTGWTSAPSDDTDTYTFNLLQELLASRRGVADRFRSSDQAAGRAREELAEGEALDLLKSATGDLDNADFEGMRQWLLLQARQKRGKAVALPQQDADTLELLGLMYAYLGREVRPDSPAAAMLQRLKLPVMRVALADAGFFVRANHPAREVLNAVAEAGARCYGPEDVDPQLLLHLHRAVDHLTQSANDPVGAFVTAMQSVEAQLQAAARRADISERRNVEAARGKDKLAIARRRATEVIDEALSGVRLPIFHRTMLRQAWADVLTLAHLRHGEDSDDWKSLIDSTGELVRSAGGETSSPGLALFVEHWLVTVGYHEDDAGRISRILTASGSAETDDASTRTELAMRLKTRARLGEDAMADTDVGPALDAEAIAHREQLKSLPPGTWFEFSGGSGHPTRRRLSWLSPITGHALFVNPRGQRVAESTVDQLAREVAAGEARVVTAGDGRLVDRAWRAALQAIGAPSAGRRLADRSGE